MSLHKLVITTLCTLSSPIAIGNGCNVWMYFHTRPLVFIFHLTYTDNTIHYFWITAQADTKQHSNNRMAEKAREVV